MKIAIDKALEFEFDPWSIEEAGKAVARVRHDHKERSAEVLRAMLTLLLFAELEAQHPGNMARMQSEIDKIVAGLKPPQPES